MSEEKNTKETSPSPESLAANKNLENQKTKKKKSKVPKRGSEQKIIPLLKPPCKRRKFSQRPEEENCKTGIIWDNKTIEEQYLDRKLHPRIKIDEPKTPYPDGDDSDLYEDGLNLVNGTKPTEELLQNVVSCLDQNKAFYDGGKKSNTAELKKKAYGSEFTKALNFYNEQGKKYEELEGERKITLQNTLINKFHKEVRSLSKGK